MKPKDLKPPFSWDERRILIQDSVMYVPEYHDEPFNLPDWSDIFGNVQPVHVEYCSGNGAWIAGKAEAHPEMNWVAVEMKFDRVRKIWSKLKNQSLKNLFVICGEAKTITDRYFADESIHEVSVNFPDPWPKKRHAKHRLIQPPFVESLARVLTSEGHVTLVTDDRAYSDQMIETFQGSSSFTSLHPTPYYITDQSEYGTSFFDQLWREKGKTIRYHKWSKK